MSEHTVLRSHHHKVTHEYSGKHHFYKIETPEGKEYQTVIKTDCNCNFMGMKGVANSKICSHIVAVCKKIAEEGQID